MMCVPTERTNLTIPQNASHKCYVRLSLYVRLVMFADVRERLPFENSPACDSMLTGPPSLNPFKTSDESGLDLEEVVTWSGSCCFVRYKKTLVDYIRMPESLSSRVEHKNLSSLESQRKTI